MMERPGRCSLASASGAECSVAACASAATCRWCHVHEGGGGNQVTSTLAGPHQHASTDGKSTAAQALRPRSLTLAVCKPRRQQWLGWWQAGVSGRRWLRHEELRNGEVAGRLRRHGAADVSFVWRLSLRSPSFSRCHHTHCCCLITFTHAATACQATRRSALRNAN
jgi:hypothetical protein